MHISDWDLADHRREEARVQNRRAVQMGSREDAPDPRTGLQGYLLHPRHGLVGGIAYWSRGVVAIAVTMIIRLIAKLDLTERVRNALPQSAADRDAETNAKIADLLEAGLAETKHCRTEQQRIEYHIGLGYVMPPRVAEGNSSGWIRRICERLGIQRGKRSAKRDARPYASDQAVDQRAQFNKDVALQKKPLQEGDKVLSHGDSCKLTRIFVRCDEEYGEEGPPCVLTFRAGEVTEEHSYKSMYGKGEGSARLQRLPPTLAPPPRETPSTAVSNETRWKVKLHAHEVCAESPCKRDAMRKHVGPRVWEPRQALILNFPKETLWAKFDQKHPGLLKESKYYEVLEEEVWNLKRAFRETCLCRTCFNCRLYREGLAVVAQILALLLKPPPSDDADDAAAEPEPPNADLQRLYDFCASHESGRRRATAELVCAESLEKATFTCLRGACRCGLSGMWKPVRKTLVFDVPAGKLKPGVSKVWLTKIKWDRIKTGGDGSNSEDEMRQQCEGTLIEFLDQASTAYSNFTPHSFHIDQAKVADRECDEHAVPGMLRDKSDWSENGECKVKHQLQSEYWMVIYYSLLISICPLT